MPDAELQNPSSRHEQIYLQDHPGITRRTPDYRASFVLILNTFSFYEFTLQNSRPEFKLGIRITKE
jgi:hypothetical protein